MPNTLFLRLEGALQSWGERARWSVRDTAPEPTKSGVVGLLGCALGYGEDDELRRLSRALHIGVRCDRPGTLLVDYHTVVGGVLSAEGKIKKTVSTGEWETVVSWRHYLCDASFLVAVQSREELLIERLAAAVQAPHWPVFLGRKSCPPSRPVFEGVGEYGTLEQALAALPLQCNLNVYLTQVRAVIECAPAEGVRRRDEIDSRRRNTFLPRYTLDTLITVPVESEVT